MKDSFPERLAVVTAKEGGGGVGTKLAGLTDTPALEPLYVLAAGSAARFSFDNGQRKPTNTTTFGCFALGRISPVVVISSLGLERPSPKNSVARQRSKDTERA